MKILDKSRPAVSLLDYSMTDIVDRLRQALELPEVEAAYLFGSLVRGKVHAWSDIDLLVVANVDLPFVERPKHFSALLEQLPFALDLWSTPRRNSPNFLPAKRDSGKVFGKTTYASGDNYLCTSRPVARPSLPGCVGGGIVTPKKRSRKLFHNRNRREETAPEIGSSALFQFTQLR
ncbi:nucleotidyltransferase domain-containing protein [Geothermobacter ehrlichii]|uniref:nucleotidyltransferase domain-containing protein n=1 Tax=Geothermobacter ehrlichii TaxID=213224 RepID=UPI0011E6A9BF|nr:nucleotidyltransferase domain-containing protein [Geothermobacter ehrlichii]